MIIQMFGNHWMTESFSRGLLISDMVLGIVLGSVFVLMKLVLRFFKLIKNLFLYLRSEIIKNPAYRFPKKKINKMGSKESLFEWQLFLTLVPGIYSIFIGQYVFEEWQKTNSWTSIRKTMNQKQVWEV